MGGGCSFVSARASRSCTDTSSSIGRFRLLHQCCGVHWLLLRRYAPSFLLQTELGYLPHVAPASDQMVLASQTGLPHHHARPAARFVSSTCHQHDCLCEHRRSYFTHKLAQECTATFCASTDAPVSPSSLIQGGMKSPAETRGSLLVAFESFDRKERNGTLTNGLHDGFLWRLRKAIQDGVVSKKGLSVHHCDRSRLLMLEAYGEKAQKRMNAPPP
jgi:hypothetical protein